MQNERRRVRVRFYLLEPECVMLQSYNVKHIKSKMKDYVATLFDDSKRRSAPF